MISDQNRIRVAIVDDEQLARERMRSLLSEHSDVELVAECADGAEAIRAIEEKQPDLPDGNTIYPFEHCVMLQAASCAGHTE